MFPHSAQSLNFGFLLTVRGKVNQEHPKQGSASDYRTAWRQGQGIPSSKPSSGIARSIPSGFTSPPSGVGTRTRPVGSGYGQAKSAPPGAADRRKVESHNNARNNHVDGGAKNSFCHDCGTRYPVEEAKFCCECGVRRMCM